MSKQLANPKVAQSKAEREPIESRVGSKPTGQLIIVSTPIGNLGDISRRASESLAVLISATDGWGASSAITYGDETAYERLSAALQDWVNQGRPGLRELRLRAVPAGTDVELQPGEHRIPKPYFDLIASYHTRV